MKKYGPHPKISFSKVEILAVFEELGYPQGASFITGLPPEKHKIQGVQEWDIGFLEALKRLPIKLHLDSIKGKGKILEYVEKSITKV